MRYILLLFLTILAGCSSLKPDYSPRENHYTYSVNQVAANNFIKDELVYTYTTQSLENKYKSGFCGGLSDCTHNIAAVKNSPQFGNFDLDKHNISNNAYNIKTIDLYRILYTTPGQFQEPENVSGAIFLPNMPADKIKGVILFFHPTFFSKTSVPSYSPEQGTDLALAGTFATNGYIVIAPDYIGMGFNKNPFHPYVVYPQINATDGLSMLTASTSFLRNKGYLANESMPLFVTGYSEGGAYALWFSRLMQEQPDFKAQLAATPYKLHLVAPISGAYDLSGVTYNYLFSDIGILTKSNFHVQSSLMAAKLKPAILAYTLTAYAYYSESSHFEQVFNPEFFNMKCTLQYSSECKFNQQQLNLYQAFSQETNDITIVNKIANAAAHKSTYGGMFIDQWNNISALVNPKLLTNQHFRDTLANGDIYYWHSVIPTTLIYLQYDSVVSNYNSIFALRGMQENGSKNLNSIAVDNSLLKENMVSILPNFDTDHINGFYYLYLVALKQFNDAGSQ